MSNETNNPDEETIWAADYSMRLKLGDVSIDKILSPAAIKEAENAIIEAADELYSDCISEAARLQTLVGQLKKVSGSTAFTLQDIISVAFSTKTKAGLSGFDLAASLAKSLQLLCEKTIKKDLGTAPIQIIEWHVQSINHLLSLKIKGNGGDAGKDILAEIEKFNL